MSEIDHTLKPPFPPLFTDAQRVREIAEWPQEILEEKAMLYGQFLCEDLMPRAKEQADYIMENVLFELAYRDGVYDEVLCAEMLA